MRRGFSSKKFSAEIDENGAITRGLDLNEGVTSSSSNFISGDFSDSKKEGEEVNQSVLNKRRRVVTPVASHVVAILVLSSDLEHSNDLAFALRLKT